ncbi:MAG: ABC transporter ATP-binding protein [Planctomycetota bacterium]
MSELLRGEAITKAYRIGKREIPVLRGVDLSVMEREIVALCGSSGAGKSTLLHVLGLLDPPTSGRVFYKDTCVSALPPREQARLRHQVVGFVFQFYHLIPELSALENVVLGEMMLRSLPAYMGQRRAIRGRAEELLVRIGLGDRLGNRPSQLSGGERQRVAIARALVSSPEVILVDEPTGNLDSHTAGEILELIWQINEEQGISFLIVTHDESVASRADRSVRLHDGRVVEAAAGTA